MATLKRQKADGTWEYIETIGTGVVNSINYHLSDMLYQTAGGTATAITLTISETLVNGLPITFIAGYTDATTTKTINGKPFYKPGTTTSPSTTIGKAYTVWYNLTDDCFFIKASAEGTATTAQVLAGVPYSNEIDTGLIGTMTNNGVVSLTSGLANQSLSGYYEPGSNIQGLQSVASSTQIAISNTSVNKKVLTPTKVHEITVNFGGTIRVNATISTQNASYSAYAQFYKNDVAVGTPFSTKNTSVFAISYDMSVVYGDKVSAYMWGASLSYYAWCNAMSICGTPSIALAGTVLL